MTKTIVKENFTSLENMIDTFNRPQNEAFQGQDLSSQKHDIRKWSGTETYSEAEDVLKVGYKEPLDKMKKAILKIGEKENRQRPRTKNDMIGFVPNVPNHLMGLPQTMINRERQAPKQKTIHLTYSFCAMAKTKTAEMIKGGINFISLVNSLEKQGYRVKIDAIFTTVSGQTTAAMIVNLKEYGQQTNLLKLAFPLVHPAMLRRFAFKWLETTPELKDKSFVYGYGTPLNYVLDNNADREREYLKENQIITGKNSYYCNVYQAIKAKDIQELAKSMEIIK